MLCVGQLFKNCLAFYFIASQEGGKLTLCQHGHAAKLCKGKTNGILNLLFDVVNGCITDATYVKTPLGFVVFETLFGFFALAFHVAHAKRESGLVSLPVVAFKQQFTITIIFR